jgi:hypothetical protein
MINDSLQHVSEEVILSTYFQKTCMAPTFFDVYELKYKELKTCLLLVLFDNS